MNRGRISSVKDIKEDWDIYDTVVYKGKKTTVGRVIFNSLLPSDYPFVDKPVDKKLLNTILVDIFKRYGSKVYKDTIEKIAREGYKWYTLSPRSISLDELSPPPEVLKLKKQLDKTKDPEEFDKIFNELIRELQKYLKQYNYDIYDIVVSGSRGKWQQLAQMLIAKGIVVDPKGNVLPPIKTSISDGLSPTEYFHAGVGARSGVIDRALNTATSGYMTRRLVFACQSVVLGKKVDCQSKRYLQIRVTKDLQNKLIGRYLSDGTLITEDYAAKLVGKVVELRSPVYCKSKQICKTCYGKLADYIGTAKIGILAAQSIGERGTQLIMRTFHMGGAVSFERIDVINMLAKYNTHVKREVLEQLFEQRDSKIVAKVDLTIQFDKEDYTAVNSCSYDKTTNTLLVQLVAGVVESSDYPQVQFIIDSPGFISNIEFDGRYYVKHVKAGNVVVELKSSTDQFLQSIQKANLLLEGRLPWKTVEQLVLTFYELYKKEAPTIALVHYEVIISNLLRNRQNPYVPARLVEPYDPVLYGLKKVPYYDGSWMLGLAFENSKKAVEHGLIEGRETAELTPLEKVLLGAVS